MRRALTALLILGSVACGSSASAPTTPADETMPDTSPEGAPRDEVVSEEVSYPVGERTVHGTLARPSTEGPHPAILVIQGSGPTDRNWEGPLMQGSHGSMRTIAPELAAAGIITLRYDKVGTGPHAAEGLPDTISWDVYEAEQRAGLAFLRQHRSVDPTRIYVLGHSEGGLHAMRLVSRLDQPPAGLILCASIVDGLGPTVIRQLTEQWQATGADPAEVERQMAPVRAAVDAIAEGRDPDLDAIPEPGVRGLIATFLEPTALPFVREYLRMDATLIVRELDLPLLVVQGDRDIQIRAVDAERLVAAATAAGNRQVTHLVAHHADHVFKVEERSLEQLHSPEVRVSLANHYVADRPISEAMLEAVVRMVRGPR